MWGEDIYAILDIYYYLFLYYAIWFFQETKRHNQKKETFRNKFTFYEYTRFTKTAVYKGITNCESGRCRDII